MAKVREAMAERSGIGAAACGAKWWTRKKAPESPRLPDEADVPVGGGRALPRRRQAMAGLAQTDFAHNLRR